MDKHSYSPISPEQKMLQYAANQYGLYEIIINATDQAIFSTTPDGIITTFNKAAEKLLGYSAVEVIGKVSPEIFHVKEELVQHAAELTLELGTSVQPDFNVLVAKLQHKQNADSKEWTFIRKDGSLYPVLVSVNCMYDREGTLIGYTGIATDITSQKKDQSLIQESEAHLQALITSLDDIVFELDEHSRFKRIWVNSDDYLFIPRERIIGKTLREIFGDDFALPFEEGLKKMVSTGESFQYEYHSIVPGDNRWFSAKCALIYEQGNRTNRISVCIQNISDRKEIELSLRASEEKFRLLAENIPGVVYLMRHDEDKTVVYINSEIETLTGYRVGDFIEHHITLRQLIHKDDELYVSNVCDKALEDKISFHVEYRILHKFGHWRWISETGIGVYSANTPLFIEGFITDISSRKESEEEMRRMADENSRIFNNSLTLSALASFDGYFRKLNPAWEKTLGWTREELLSKKFIDFVHPDDVQKTKDVISYISSGNSVTTFENRYRCKDGTYRWLLWASSPDIARKIIYASAIDITGRKRSEEELLLSKRNLEVAAYELQEQNRQLDEFAHIISHNLRAPVGNIKALLNFITDTSRMEDYQLIFEKIKNVTYNISETMNELMETIKIKKNSEIERVEIRFKDILDKVVQSIEGELIESGATVTYNFNNAPKIYYSKTYLESILQNLITNAIKYRSPQRIPEIFISTDIIKTGIELRVQDNGLGIDMALFGDKLFGLHKTFHENTEARGVGLFLTKTQIEAMGGNIFAESEVDKGTTFIIQF